MSALTVTALALGVVGGVLFIGGVRWIVRDLREEAEHRRAEQWRAEEKQRRLADLRATERSYWADQEGRPE